MTKLDDLARHVREHAVTFTSTRPWLYYGLRQVTGNLNEWCVAPDTELVIEGYPRSANSTTAFGFLDRQPGPVKLAHHKHHVAQLLRAVEWGLPAVMLIRAPQQAVLSFLALDEEIQHRETIRPPGKIGFAKALQAWLVFYRAALPYTQGMVIAPFEEVTADISIMIRAVNARFGTAFAAGPPLRETKLGYHAMPNHLRREIKSKLEEDFARKLESSSRLRSMLNAANALHHELIVQHEFQGRLQEAGQLAANSARAERPARVDSRAWFR